MLAAVNRSLQIQTAEAPDFIDITEEVEEIVEESEVETGVAVVYSKHTTAGVVINENESLLLDDMAEFLEELAPCDDDYRHNDFSIRTENMTDEECPNGHAHCQHLNIGASESIPIIDEELQFGDWQRVFLIELDHAREREVLVQVLGS